MSKRDTVTAGGIPVWGPTWVALRKRFDRQEGFQFIFGPHASEHGIATSGEEQRVAIEYAPESESLVIILADEVDDSFETYPLRPTNIGSSYPPNHETTLPPDVCEKLGMDYQQYDESDPLIFHISEVQDQLLPLWPEGPQSAVLEDGQLLDPEDYDFDSAASEHDSVTNVPLSQRILDSVNISDNVPVEQLKLASAVASQEVAATVPESQDRFDPVESGSKRLRFLPPGTWGEYSGEYADIIESVALAHRREAEQIAGELEEPGDRFEENSDFLIIDKNPDN